MIKMAVTRIHDIVVKKCQTTQPTGAMFSRYCGIVFGVTNLQAGLWVHEFV